MTQVIEESTVIQQPEHVVRTTKVVPAIKTESPQSAFEKKKFIFRTYQIIWYILAVIEVLLAFRMTLQVFGANPFSPFTNLIYTLSGPLASPFSGILGTYVYGNSTFEWSTIIAAIVYALVAYGIVYLIQLVKPVSPDEVTENVDNA